MKKNFSELIQSNKILLADGAMGTELFRKGLKYGDCPEEFNLIHPEIIKEITESYLEAGADIIQANTFGASPLKLADYNLDDKYIGINSSGVRIAKEVIGNSAFISASVGPCGKILEPYGDISASQMKENYRKQIEILIQEGADIICIETMTDFNEALIVLEVSKTISDKIPVIASMVFEKSENGYFTIMGNSIVDSLSSLIKNGADMIGSNCGYGILSMISIAEEFRKFTKHPLIIKSNAGLPHYENNILKYSETPDYMAEKIKSLIDINVNIIGGCCGTTPEYIKSFRKVIDSFLKNSKS
jgi:5-methyltetrahydrofolate--homocysteine methyltransferase